MLKVAITGNIASGKSQVEALLIKDGYTVYDADDIAHKVLDTLSEFYNQDVFTNGKIDRIKLGKLVFNNPEYRKKLENITHPKIKNEIIKLFEKHKNESVIFVSVPLLYEAGFETIFDKVIFVETDKTIQLERLMKRNNLTIEDAKLRINAQMPQENKIAKADFVVKNNTTLEELNKQLERVIELLKAEK